MDPRALLVLAPLLLAGCFSSSPATSTTQAQPTTMSLATTTAPVHAPKATVTDSLHLLDPPHLLAGASDRTTDIVLHVASITEVAAGTGSALEWRLPRPATLASITTNYTLWVDVEGTVLNPESTSSGCFWNIVMLVQQDDGSSTGMPVCVQEPAVLSTGIRALHASFADFDIRNAPGKTIVLQILTTGTYGPGATVDLLTGTPQHDSQFSIKDLAFPIDTTTLLTQ